MNVLRRNVCAMLHQRLRGIRVARCCRQVQRREVFNSLRLDVRAELN